MGDLDGTGDQPADTDIHVDAESSAAPQSAEPVGRAETAPAADVTDDRPAGDDLADLDARPLAEHAEAYERLHGRLQAALADIDGA